MSSQINIEDHRSIIGSTRRLEFGEITRREARRYARAVEDDYPPFCDVSAARENGYDDLIVPPTFVPAIMEPGPGRPVEELRADGLDPKRYFIPVPGDTQILGGGLKLFFERYITVGERITAETEVADLYQKENESDSVLSFLELNTQFKSGGDDVIRSENTVIMLDHE